MHNPLENRILQENDKILGFRILGRISGIFLYFRGNLTYLVGNLGLFHLNVCILGGISGSSRQMCVICRISHLNCRRLDLAWILDIHS